MVCGLVLSFGIVMWEIIAREVPYEDRGYEWIQEVKDAVVAGIRPTIRRGRVRDDYCGLMRQCWAPNPEQRPEFAEIVRGLQEILPEGVERDTAEGAAEAEEESNV